MLATNGASNIKGVLNGINQQILKEKNQELMVY
jgi:hypothetical protein